MRALTASGLAVVVSLAACVGADPDTSPPSGVDGGGADAGSSGAGDASPDGSGTDDGGSGGDGGLAKPGDVVVLDGAGIVDDGNGAVKEWRSELGGLSAKPTGPVAPSIAPFPGKASERCVVFAGERPLAIPASAQIDLGFDDFSVTVVAIRGPSHADAPDPKPDFGRVIVARNTLGPGYPYKGFALMSDWQSLAKIEREPRWAARLAFTDPDGLEVKGELRAVDGVREVVVMYRRGDQLFLKDGPAPHPPTTGASAYDVSSALYPLTIGQADDEDDPATRFAGRVCAIVIHRGPETDAEIVARIALLEARYPKP